MKKGAADGYFVYGTFYVTIKVFEFQHYMYLYFNCFKPTSGVDPVKGWFGSDQSINIVKNFSFSFYY